LRISLPSGSYVPQFHWPSADAPHVAQEAETVPDGAADYAAANKTHLSSSAVLRWIAAAALVFALAVVALLVWQRSRQSAFDSFWQPLLSPQEPVCCPLPISSSIRSLSCGTRQIHRTSLC
jgi:hypothetical protein